jgi:hypothetical protein
VHRTVRYGPRIARAQPKPAAVLFTVVGFVNVKILAARMEALIRDAGDELSPQKSSGTTSGQYGAR